MVKWRPFSTQIDCGEENPYGATIARFNKRMLHFAGMCCSSADLWLSRILKRAKNENE